MMGESSASVSTREKTLAPRQSDNWSRKTAILIWTLLTTNLLLVILVMRVTVTHRERHAEQETDYYPYYSLQNETASQPLNVTTASQPLNVTTGLCRTCPKQWIQIERKCYFISENNKTKEESEKSCGQMGARLATVKEGAILRLVTIMALEFWVGISASGSHYQEDSWIGVWSDASTVSVREGSGTCVKLGRRLIFENCYKELGWICEKNV